jgi:hypothetical protein
MPKKRPSPAKAAAPQGGGKPRYMQVRLTDVDLRLMRIMSAETGKSLQHIALQALNEYLLPDLVMRLKLLSAAPHALGAEF